VQVFGLDLDLGLLAVPFTMFWLLGAVNSLNLIDGMDGLLGSVGLILSLTLAVMAALLGQWATAVVAVALAGGLIGFLRYNFPPASVFLGDSGSMVIGLILGTLAILGSFKAPATIVLAMPVALLTLPIFDTAAAIIRRKLTGRSIYTTDRGHLHHCLQRSGLSRPTILLLVAGFCLLTGAGVVASRAFDNDWFALLTGVAVVAILVVTRLFGHAEALLIKERLTGLASRLFGKSSPQARQLSVRLQGSADWKSLWSRLTHLADDLNLEQVRLNVNAPMLHEGYHARWDRAVPLPEDAHVWRVEVPLTAHGIDVGRLELVGPHDDVPVWRKIEAFTGVIDLLNEAIPAPAPRVEPRSARDEELSLAASR
jgi:UDP-GlcNAc:undecaprenyl-phosphate GlcNAc-1-phosphate transferase